jgi:hypothetical protein
MPRCPITREASLLSPPVVGGTSPVPRAAQLQASGFVDGVSRG